MVQEVVTGIRTPGLVLLPGDSWCSL